MATKINSTNRIVVPTETGYQNICTSDPYFTNSNQWYINPASSGVLPVFTNGEVIINSGDNSTGLNYLSIVPAGTALNGVTNVGYIVTLKNVELTKGMLRIFAGTVGAFGYWNESITESGRFTGVLTKFAAPYFGLNIYASDCTCSVTELLFFNADKYKYTDFIDNPVSSILMTDSPPEQSQVLPRLGFSDAVPNGFGYGPWLGNQLLQSNSLSSSPWTQGLSMTQGATAPDGTSTAWTVSSFNGSGGGAFSQFITFPAGTEVTVSFYGKKGTTPYVYAAMYSAVYGALLPGQSAATVEGDGQIYNSGLTVMSSSWSRFIVRFKSPATYSDWRFSFYPETAGVGSGKTVLLWGFQFVYDQIIPGAYTPTTTAVAPAGTQPLLGGVAPVQTPSYKVGDRLENTAWDGKYSTPTAWVCVGAGSPGLWAAVNVFDAYNSSPDPYLQSYVGGAWTTDIASGNGTAVVNGAAVLTPGTSAYAGLVSAATVGCAVKYELITVEYTSTVATGAGNLIRVAGSAVNDTAITVGSASVDKTITAFSTQQVAIYAGLAGNNLTVTRAIVRPKYPFLTTTPSSFAGLPTANQVSSVTGATGLWYYDTSYPVTYSAGVITLSGAYSTVWQFTKERLIVGKTYRVRVNVVANPAGSSLVINVANSAWSSVQIIPLDSSGTTGIKEVTFTVTNANATKVAIQATSAAAYNQQIDYIRFYTE